VTVKCRAAIKALCLYVNVYPGSMLHIHATSDAALELATSLTLYIWLIQPRGANTIKKNEYLETDQWNGKYVQR
jgi:hypothetical protein